MRLIDAEALILHLEEERKRLELSLSGEMSFEDIGVRSKITAVDFAVEEIMLSPTVE